ncbi:hypothetical protein ACGFYA_10140 [Streptomyces sp. NPDC048305]
MVHRPWRPVVHPEQYQALLVYTAIPGSEDDDKLRLLPVLGTRAAGT